MTQPDESEARRAWYAEVLPNDLGDDNHRWSWLMEASGDGRNIMWGHRCKGGRYSISWIDLTSGTMHRLVSEDPLHVEPSVLCSAGCGDHGFVREGRWISA